MLRKPSQRRLEVVASHLQASSLARPTPRIDVTPSVCLVDDKIDIRVRRLEPGQVVTLVAKVEENGKKFQSHAVFKANSEGEVDVSQDEPLAGTYTGVDPMGLCWSLKSYSVKNARFIKKDVTSPVTMTLNLMPGAIDEDNINVDDAITRTRIERYFMQPGVTRRPVTEGKFRGTIFIPPGKGPFPAMVDLYGGLVSRVETRAALLASHGFATFAVTYLYVDHLPDSAQDMDSNYLKDATEWFSQHSFVDSERLGAIGLCLGGFLVHMLAALCKQVKVVVIVNGLPFFDVKEGSTPERPWPYADRVYGTEEGVVINEMHLDEGKGYHFVPSWQNGAKILNIVGEDDLQNHPTLATRYMEACPQKFKDNLQLVSYPGAGHLIEPPYTPLCRVIATTRERMASVGFIPEELFDKPMMAGGFPKEHAYAQEDSWRKIIEFFQRNL